jgi:hypothetical protein
MFKVTSFHLRDAPARKDDSSWADAGQESADGEGKAVSGQGVKNAVSRPALGD